MPLLNGAFELKAYVFRGTSVIQSYNPYNEIHGETQLP